MPRRAAPFSRAPAVFTAVFINTNTSRRRSQKESEEECDYSLRGFAVVGLSLFLFVLRRSRTDRKFRIHSRGTVKDQSGGAIANATVEISYAVSGFHREIATGGDGSFKFTNVPFNSYHLSVTAEGFSSYEGDVDVRSAVPMTVQVSLKIGTQYRR